MHGDDVKREQCIPGVMITSNPDLKIEPYSALIVAVYDVLIRYASYPVTVVMLLTSSGELTRRTIDDIRTTCWVMQ